MNATTSVDNKTARRMLAFIDEFRKLSPTINSAQIAVFLHVAAAGDAGISMKDIERRSGLPSSTVSRRVLALSEWEKKDTPGHNLVENFEDLNDRRNKLVRLKHKGKTVYNSLISIFGS